MFAESDIAAMKRELQRARDVIAETELGLAKSPGHIRIWIALRDEKKRLDEILERREWQ